MVLIQDSRVLWFTPSTAAAAATTLPKSKATPPNDTSASPGRVDDHPSKASLSSLQSKPSEQDSSSLHVYGPSFARVPRMGRSRRSGRARGAGAGTGTGGRGGGGGGSSRPRRTATHSTATGVPPHSSTPSPPHLSSSITPSTGSLPRIVYPNDSKIGAPSYTTEEEEDDMLQEGLAGGLWGPDDVYFGEMPFELLENIFQNLIQVSGESLAKLSEERNLARIRASKRTTMAASSGGNLHGVTGGHSHSHSHLIHCRHHHSSQVRRSLCHRASTDGSPFHSHCQGGHFLANTFHLHQHPTRRHLHADLFQGLQRQGSSSTSGLSQRAVAGSSTEYLMDQELSYDGEEEDDDEEAETDSDGSGSSREEASDLASMLSHLALGDLGLIDAEESESEDEDDEGSQDIAFGYQDDSTASSSPAPAHTLSSAASSTDEGDSGLMLEHTVDTEHSASGASVIAATTMDSGSSGTESTPRHTRQHCLQHYHHRPRSHSIHGHLQSHHHPHLHPPHHHHHQHHHPIQPHTRHRTFLPFSSPPRHGINRADSDLDDESSLYLLQRDQYFHPTTHISLPSDLYICSLVNRQWRLAALQLLWQSVVLDSESCRPEPSDPCFCSRQPKARQGLYHADSMPRMVRTRIEAMLDTYLECYGIDLAKSVQTVELDLRLLAWSTEGDSVKRILRRLAPFAHLRLVWAEKESADEMVEGFKGAMESIHCHVRHVHFLAGFSISRAWVKEMEKMSRLEKLTIESLGNLEVVEFDWARIKVLVLNSMVPRTVFGSPAPPPPPPPQPSHLLTTIADPGVTQPDQVPVAPAHLQGSSNLMALTPQDPSPWLELPPGLDAVTPTVNPDLSQVPTLVAIHPQVQAQPNATPLPQPTTPAEMTLPAQGSGLVVRSTAMAAGWWHWTGLRKLEIKIKSMVLPREWLQDLTTTLSVSSLAGNVPTRQFAVASSSASLSLSSISATAASTIPVATGTAPTTAAATTTMDQATAKRRMLRMMPPKRTGPQIEVFDLDCEVSHPHRDIFMDMVHGWGPHLEEFHFAQSAELTDEFLWLCLQKMPRLRKLSLRDSKGITGEGVVAERDFGKAALGVLEDGGSEGGGNLQGAADALVESLGIHSAVQSSGPRDRAEDGGVTKRVEVPIRWGEDFTDLRLDQSRVRREFLVGLKSQCPGARYKVREVRWRPL